MLLDIDIQYVMCIVGQHSLEAKTLEAMIQNLFSKHVIEGKTDYFSTQSIAKDLGILGDVDVDGKVGWFVYEKVIQFAKEKGILMGAHLFRRKDNAFKEITE